MKFKIMLIIAIFITANTAVCFEQSYKVKHVAFAKEKPIDNLPIYDVYELNTVLTGEKQNEKWIKVRNPKNAKIFLYVKSDDLEAMSALNILPEEEKKISINENRSIIVPPKSNYIEKYRYLFQILAFILSFLTCFYIYYIFHIRLSNKKYDQYAIAATKQDVTSEKLKSPSVLILSSSDSLKSEDNKKSNIVNTTLSFPQNKDEFYFQPDINPNRNDIYINAPINSIKRIDSKATFEITKEKSNIKNSEIPPEALKSVKRKTIEDTFPNQNNAYETINQSKSFINEQWQQDVHINIDTYKKEWREYRKILQNHNIKKLYHFTDKENLFSIIKHGYLYSWHYLEKNNIGVPRPGGNALSRKLDSKKELEDYVRISFNKNQPMLYLAQKDGRILNPVIIEIDPEVIYWQNTKYSNMNAAANQAEIGEGIGDFRKIKMDIVLKDEFDYMNKSFYQAEILVKTKISIDFFKNLPSLLNEKTIELIPKHNAQSLYVTT